MRIAISKRLLLDGTETPLDNRCEVIPSHFEEGLTKEHFQQRLREHHHIKSYSYSVYDVTHDGFSEYLFSGQVVRSARVALNK